MITYYEHVLQIVLIAISIGFGVARFLVPVEGKINTRDIFKDMAHIWVGILIGVSLMDVMYWWLPVILTVVEIVAFVVRKK